MKKVLALFLVVIIFTLSLSSCSASEKSSSGDALTVSFSDGSVQMLSAKELVNLYNTNERKFKEIKLVRGKGIITNKGYIETIGWSGMNKIPSYWAKVVDVGPYLEISIPFDDENDKPVVYNGDSIEFCGVITKVFGGTVTIQASNDFSGHYVKIG